MVCEETERTKTERRSDKRPRGVGIPGTRVGKIGISKEMRMAVKTFRDLVAWQKALALAREIYRATLGAMPREERFGADDPDGGGRRSQLPSRTIAEGYGRPGTARNLLRFSA